MQRLLREPNPTIRSPHNTAIQVAHIARATVETLAGRPLSHSNAPFVATCLKSLDLLARRMEEVRPYVVESCRPGANHFVQLLRRVASKPTATLIAEVGRFVRDDFQPYANLMRASLPELPATPDPFQSGTPGTVVVSIGPGIGIGDEIKLHVLLAQLQRHFRLDDSAMQLCSYCPGVWRTLEPGWVTRDMTLNPLETFDLLAESRKHKDSAATLVVFADFLRRNSARTLVPYKDCYDVLDIALGSGEARLRKRGQEADLVACTLDQAHPCFSRAVKRMANFLFPRGEPSTPTESGIAVPSRPSAGSEPFRILLSPFTSKLSPLSAGDWSSFIVAMARSLSPGRQIVCQVIPGLTEACNAHALDICRLVSHQLDGRGRAELIAQDPADFTVENAFARIYDRLLEADLLFGIDTFTAHLAAKTGTVSVAISLDQNVRFWDPSQRTFWFNIRAGHEAVTAASRAVCRLLDSRGRRTPPLVGFVEVGKELAERAPLTSDQTLKILDRAWQSLPTTVSRALERLDDDLNWPRLAREFRENNPAGQNLVCRSNFARLLSLASTQTRGSYVAVGC
jgi:hypothetical protein